MKPGSTRPESLRFQAAFFLAAVFCFLLAATQSHGESISAIYTHSELSLTIPYHSTRTGPGTLVVELLNPEGKILGRTERDLETKPGDSAWNIALSSAEPIPFDDLVWERVRYRYVYTGETVPAFEAVRAVSEILRRPVVRILGQSAYLAGGEAAVRLLVSDPDNHTIPGESTLRVELRAPGQSARMLYTGRTDRRGAVNAQLRFPAGLTGNCELHFVALTPIGSAEFTQPIRLENKASILLTTEKPIYQPGQTIHVRALALDRASHHATSSPLTFEIEDSRGNKVFKKITSTDEFGIASTEFTLADEVNLGTYHLRALMGRPDAPSNTAELAFNVERYVLPKFKVAIDFAQQNGKPRRDYRPGDHVTGTIHANYFFGEPVSSANVEIKASTMDVAIAQAASSSGITDKDGAYRFDLKLPAYFAGRPLNNGAAPVLIEATVKDTSGHAETRNEPITVSQSSILVTAVPESSALVPGLENQVYLLASYPDGSPAAADLFVHIPGVSSQKVATDSSGVAVIRFTPKDDTTTLSIDASDSHGNHATASIPLQSAGGEDHILLRTDRAVYQVGEPMQLSIFSTAPGGAVYIDVVSNGQTILTRDVDVHSGQASLGLEVTPAMAGTLEIDAYRFGENAQAIADRRIVFIQPAAGLHIEATADATVYKPGADARIRFRVTGEHGEAVHAAIGLQIVDEAVFALAEKQPGFAKVFFYLEQELMKPRYEIHSLTLNDVIEPVAVNNADVDARALFANMQMANPGRLDTEFGRTLPQEKAPQFNERYQKAFHDQITRLASTLSAVYEKSTRHEELPYLFAELSRQQPAQLHDAWASDLRLEPLSWYRAPQQKFYRIVSAGPDRQFDTADDLSATIGASTRVQVDNPHPNGTNIQIEHNRGPLNGLAAIAGAVTDRSGAVVPNATITARTADEHNPRTTKTDANGSFSFAGLPPGRYALRIESPGFQIAESTFTLATRDRAVVSAVLEVGAVTQAVNVVAGQPAVFAVREMEFAPMQVAAPGAMHGVAIMAGNMAVMDRDQLVAQKALRQELKATGTAMGALDSAVHETHIRSYFPEALYINPEIITDSNGEATIEVPIADSITTWRMAMLASTVNGALGTATSSLKVFQDFFADLDLPVTLTQGDRITIPAAVYNYTGSNGNVELTLKPDDWYALADDAGTKTVSVNAGQVGGTHFTLQANRIGKFKLTLSAHMNGASERRDIVVREIEVVPNGREQNTVFNGRLDGTNVDTPGNQATERIITFPAQSIPDASKILVRIYPGPLSQVVEGMDSLLRMPFGCFEQTSSSTYPNVLALDYMKRTNKLTPEIHAKAEGYIATGYQRLLTFEVPGGGFSWFGNPPANKILTAYGLMEFSDMSKVHDVDPRLIERTRNWLIAQQQPDGSWKPDTSFINEGATNRYNSDLVRITAYIAWSLEVTGYRGAALDKAAQFLSAHLDGKSDSYTLAVLANFAVEHDKNDALAHQALQMLLDDHQENGDQIWWTAPDTNVYSTGESAAVETTGLAVQALLKAHQSPETVHKALAWITSKKEASGTWGTTQATIMALRALLMASEESTADVRGTVEIAFNGKTAEKLELTPENNDLFHQVVLTAVDTTKPSNVQIHFTGSGSLAYQVVGRYFLPWEAKAAPEPLSINVAYDRTKLAQNDIVTATATIRSNLKETANMVMVDLGIPPGFDLLTEDLQDLVSKTADARSGRLEKFSLTATQAILYFDSFAPGSETRIHFRLRAKYPIRAKTFESKVYEYYDPAVSSIAAPAELEVSAR
ncbi:MAG TPA: MG2 domain-containing protein [Terracidiphilus sp.]|nr:MG2 domain-containing protein [Terracidiphilus sp.]